MKKHTSLTVFSLILTLFALKTAKAQTKDNNLQPAKLFSELPDYCPTPDAFAIALDGSLTLSVPNFADKTKPGILMRLSTTGEASKLGEVPVLESTGRAIPMGIAYDNEGALYICDNQVRNQGRLMRLTFNDGKIASQEIVASGFKSINGIRFQDGFLYVTQTSLPKFNTEKLTSGVYRFKISDRNIKINNDSTDRNLIFTNQTQNPDKQFGLDGIVLDKKGNLYVANFGDATVYKLKLNKTGKVIKEDVYAQLPITAGVDGMHMDNKRNIYACGFMQNQIFKITPKGKVILIAEYPDNDGSDGQIDQPADLIVYRDKIIISNFDLLTGPEMVNTKHNKPYTISYIDL